MTRRRPAYKAEFRLLTPAQAPPKKKGRLHSAPPTQERYDDQAQDRPQHVVLPLLAARVRNLPQNRFQLQCRGLLKSGSLLNQNIRARSICSVRSIDCPVLSATAATAVLVRAGSQYCRPLGCGSAVVSLSDRSPPCRSRRRRPIGDGVEHNEIVDHPDVARARDAHRPLLRACGRRPRLRPGVRRSRR